MRACIQMTMLKVFLIGLLVCVGAADVWAQAVVSDTQSTGKTIKQWFTEVKESKTVVSTMETVRKTSAAIGSAKKSVTEYVMKNKQKIEEKIAKVKKYKEKAEAYKKQYDEYKSQLDERIAQAKELKAKAEEGIETAKNAKEMASGAINAAKAKVGGAVDAAKDKAGIKDKETEPAAESATAAENALPAAGGQDEAAPAAAAGTPAEGAMTAGGSQTAETPVSSRQPFAGAAQNATDAMAENTPASMEQAAAAALDATELKTFNSLQKKANLSVAEKQKFEQLNQRVLTKRNELKIQPAQIAVTDVAKGQLLKSKAAVLDKASAVSETAHPAVTKAVRPTMTKAVRPAVTKDVPEVRTKAVEPAKKNNLRKAFTTSSLHREEQLAFAFALKLPDNGTDINGTVIIPEALALYCGLSSDGALKPGAVDACLRKINKESQGAQVYSGSDAPKVYNRALAQYVAAGIAEAYKARQEADSFEEKFVDAVDFAPEPTTRDTYANIVELNKAIDMQMNNLLKVFSTQLAARAMTNYGTYTLMPPEETAKKTEGGNE